MQRHPDSSRDSRDHRNPRDARDPRDSISHHTARASGPPRERRANVTSGVPHGATESGWLPDCVYTGEKFEPGLAFFADAVGRITRFSREPADLTAARRLEGQAALPGLIDAHSHAFQRTLRGRTERRAAEAHERVLSRISAEEVFDTARMAFLEMLLSGVVCVGEFHYLHHQPDGAPWPEPNRLAREIVRAAHDVGIRIALLNVAYGRGDFPGKAGSASAPAPVRFQTANTDQFLRETEMLRVAMEKEFPADEAWVGVGAYSLAQVPLDQFKAVATYARAQRIRLHAHLSTTAAENAACVAEYGRSPVALLAEHGIVDKRFTAIDALELGEEEVKLLGAARASVCVCPISGYAAGLGLAPVEKFLAAGIGVALGTDDHGQIDLLKEARMLEYGLRAAQRKRAAVAPEAATALFHAATVAGARSLGATGGALEVGRPADFFTVSLHDPSIVGADHDTLLANIVFALERRAIREVWIGARQRLANGRHPLHGPIVGRFADAQRRIWGG